MKSKIKLKEDRQHFEYMEAEITLVVRVYSEQEDMTHYISEEEAKKRVKQHICDIGKQGADPFNLIGIKSIKIIE